MFNFLKKKIREFISGTKEEIEKQESREERVIEKEIKEVEKVEQELEEKKEKAEEKAEEDEKITKKEEEQIAKLEEKEEAVEEKKEGLFSKLKKLVTTTKLSEDNFDKFFNNLEMVLIENNVAMEAIDSLRESLKKELQGKEIKHSEFEKKIKESLEKAISALLIEPFDLVEKIKQEVKEKKPYIIVFFGINGSGKTTTIAKIAHLLKKNKITSVLAASDTFRAASIEQLQIHADRLGLEMIKHKYGADPAAVAFDAISHAKAQALDAVLIDTAGRMHTKADLMREMEKIVRVAKPDLKIFIGEAITGNDAIEQARAFNDVVGIDAIILSKADVDEKGGATISVSHVTKKPILFLGTGQEYDDLKKFDKNEIIKKIFD